MAGKPDATVLALGAKDFFEPVFKETWKKLSIDEQVAFRNKLNAYTKAAAKVRARFDQTVYKGHTDGSVSDKVESIRAERNPDAATPGRKAVAKTMEDILLAE
jgi:hypothetical protein